MYHTEEGFFYDEGKLRFWITKEMITRHALVNSDAYQAEDATWSVTGLSLHASP